MTISLLSIPLPPYCIPKQDMMRVGTGLNSKCGRSTSNEGHCTMSKSLKKLYYYLVIQTNQTRYPQITEQYNRKIGSMIMRALYLSKDIGGILV